MHTLTHNVFFFLKLQTVLFFFSLLSNQWQKLHFVRNDHQYAHQLGAIVSISLVNQTVFRADRADKVGGGRERKTVWPNSPGF